MPGLYILSPFVPWMAFFCCCKSIQIEHFIFHQKMTEVTKNKVTAENLELQNYLQHQIPNIGNRDISHKNLRQIP